MSPHVYAISVISAITYIICIHYINYFQFHCSINFYVLIVYAIYKIGRYTMKNVIHNNRL